MANEVPSDRRDSPEGYSVHPLSTERRLIWDGMRLSRQFFLNHQVFLVRFDAAEECRQESRRIGQPAPSYAACAMHAIAQVLPRHPWLNVYLTPFPRRIVLFADVDLCYTVECNAEGAEPYVGFSFLRNASRLSLREISAETARVRAACDAGSQIARHPYSGSPTVVRWLRYTFGCAHFPAKVRNLFGTVGFTSVGKWGAAITTPLAPRSLTFSLGSVGQQALVIDGAVKPCLAAWMTVTYDHRIADGSQVARLGSEIAKFLARFPVPAGAASPAVSMPEIVSP